MNGSAVWFPDPAGIYFSDRFNVQPDSLTKYGAFDISLVEDSPVFIDPFLLFNSEDADYQALHEQVLEYLRFLKEKSVEKSGPGALLNWYTFSEVKQNWLGFSVDGNAGRGLGRKFAQALQQNLAHILSNFGSETITKSSHIEKLALIQSGVGRDMISDFTTNLLKHFLLQYTEKFASAHIDPAQCRAVRVPRAAFSYKTESWATREYTLPWTSGDFVILTPMDLLTTVDTWINGNDMIRSYDRITLAVPDEGLRAQANNYLGEVLTKNPTPRERNEAIAKVLRQFPELIDYYIKTREDTGESAAASSLERVSQVQTLMRDEVQAFAHGLAEATDFFKMSWTSLDEAISAAETFKHYVEDKDGWRVLVRNDGRPVLAKESEVQLFFGLLLQNSRFDVNREPNNGRGPVDFKISNGLDKTLLEFKLASNSHLKRNLQSQVDIYAAANDTQNSVTVIICYSESELTKVASVKKELGLDVQQPLKKVVVVDASPKASASTV